MASSSAATRAIAPEVVWAAVEGGQAELLDLRTTAERRRFGAPPGAKPVSLAKHMANPRGTGVVYLCQHAVRSKWTLRRGG